MRRTRGARLTAGRPFIVVVDDDESVRESLPDLLRECGYSVSTFPSAEEFLASRAVERTDCLILDYAMPGMSGLELQHELTRRGNPVPIVFITGNEDDSIRPLVVAAGAVDCLFKPFSEDQLLDAVSTALEVA